jgi:hypothetical protein
VCLRETSNLTVYILQTGAKLENTYQSTVYYHANNPIYSERILVELPQDQKLLEKCHLYVEAFHFSSEDGESPIGFCYMSLSDPDTKIFMADKARKQHVHPLALCVISQQQRHVDLHTALLRAQREEGQ